MYKLCKHGHVQSPENQYRVNDKQRGIRYRCKPCALAARKVKGTPHLIEVQVETHLNRVEDIEFLLAHGVNGVELVERTGYSTKKRLKEALQTAGRNDLLRRVR